MQLWVVMGRVGAGWLMAKWMQARRQRGTHTAALGGPLGWVCWGFLSVGEPGKT